MPHKNLRIYASHGFLTLCRSGLTQSALSGRFGGTKSLQELILVGCVRPQSRQTQPTKGEIGAVKPPRTPPPRKSCRLFFARRAKNNLQKKESTMLPQATIAFAVILS